MNFKPEKIFYEPAIQEYELGIKLLNKFKDSEWIPIASHNNIPELRQKANHEFTYLKRLLIVGTRKTHRYVANEKVSDFLVPWTSSGCSAACLYCYLVCNYNKCSYLRVFVNREKMMRKLILQAQQNPNSVFEIGSNSDLILENQITNNLPYTINNFCAKEKARITFPTKFSMVQDMLTLKHKGRVIVRMSVNPAIIINRVELGTSSLPDRAEAINDLCEAGYRVGILLAPIILIDNWQQHYLELLDYLADNLTNKVKKQVFFEIIFMTYSYVQNAINTEAFPNAYKIFNKQLMKGRGRGKYCYKAELKQSSAEFLTTEVNGRFGENKIIYIA